MANNKSKNQSANQFFDDFMKLSGSVMNTAFASAADMKKSFEDMVDQKFEIMLKKHGFITREEYEVTKEIAVKALKEVEALKKKLEKTKK